MKNKGFYRIGDIVFLRAMVGLGPDNKGTFNIINIDTGVGEPSTGLPEKLLWKRVEIEELCKNRRMTLNPTNVDIGDIFSIDKSFHIIAKTTEGMKVIDFEDMNRWKDEPLYPLTLRRLRDYMATRTITNVYKAPLQCIIPKELFEL